MSASSRGAHLSTLRTAERAVSSSSAGTRTLLIFRFLPGLQHLAQRPVCEKNSINVHGINFPIKKRASALAARERTDRSTLSPPPPPSMCVTGHSQGASKVVPPWGKRQQGPAAPQLRQAQVTEGGGRAGALAAESTCPRDEPASTRLLPQREPRSAPSGGRVVTCAPAHPVPRLREPAPEQERPPRPKGDPLGALSCDRTPFPFHVPCPYSR